LPDKSHLTIAESDTIEQAFQRLNANMLGILFAHDAEGRVIGAVTDGDIRHAFVRGINLHDDVGQAMTRTFVHGEPGMSPTELRARLPGRTRVMPILDPSGRLVDYASLETLGNGKS